MCLARRQVSGVFSLPGVVKKCPALRMLVMKIRNIGRICWSGTLCGANGSWRHYIDTRQMFMYTIFRSVLYFLVFFSLSLNAAPFKVVIDPGHGGVLKKGVNDGTDRSHGASYNNAKGKTAKGEVLEKDLALKYSRALAAELRKLPETEVFLTREKDVSISAMKRAALGVEKQADVFLSIHFNGGGGQGARAYVVAEDHARWEYMHFTNPYWKRDAALGRKWLPLLITPLNNLEESHRRRRFLMTLDFLPRAMGLVPAISKTESA